MKKIAVLLLFLIGLIGITSCGSNDSGDAITLEGNKFTFKEYLGNDYASNYYGPNYSHTYIEFKQNGVIEIYRNDPSIGYDMGNHSFNVDFEYGTYEQKGNKFNYTLDGHKSLSDFVIMDYHKYSEELYNYYYANIPGKINDETITIEYPHSDSSYGKFSIKVVYELNNLNSDNVDAEEFKSSDPGYVLSDDYKWSDVGYYLNLDNYNAVAFRVCVKGNIFICIESEIVNTTYEVIKPATEFESGKGQYSATFTNEIFGSTTFEDYIPMIVVDAKEEGKVKCCTFNYVRTYYEENANVFGETEESINQRINGFDEEFTGANVMFSSIDDFKFYTSSYTYYGKYSQTDNNVTMTINKCVMSDGTERDVEATIEIILENDTLKYTVKSIGKLEIDETGNEVNYYSRYIAEFKIRS
ncbi:MAG: hypothetical protein IJR67_01035 [Acholeplasmatales bacterium]|nr:hypothetical protein [Acholeplasmatales bacterium]